MLSSYEEIASQWHPTKNNGLTPDKVKANSIEKYWFLCPNTCNGGCLHEWFATPQSRTLKKTGCPYCAKGSTVICIHESLSHKYQDLMIEWNYEKNMDIDPNKIRPGSDKKVSWICKVCAMEWDAAIKARTKGSGCPGCNGKVGVKPVTKMNSLEGKFPEIAKEWHPTKNGDKLPSQYKYGSLEKVWWLCPNTCGYEGCITHEYQATINARTNPTGTGCPYCAKNSQRICYHRSLEFRYPEIAKMWHPEKNGDLKPCDVTPYTNKRVWWYCKNVCDYGCIHEYEQDISNKTTNMSGCPFCIKTGSKNICIHNSFEFNYPKYANELHPTKNNDIDLTKITKHSKIKLWWLCPVKCKYGCLHEYEQSIDHKSKGTGCPFCLAYGDAKQFCYHESLEFKYPDLMKEWDYEKNSISPKDLTPKSGFRAWWKCNKNHEWSTRIFCRTVYGNCCRVCNIGNNYSKISIQWLNYLGLTYKIQHAENGGEFCVPNTKFKSDGYCIETNTIFEFHGNIWHGNPKMFKMEDINLITGITYGELYDKTIQKRDKLIKLGYNYFEVWEKDWKDGIKALRKIQRIWKKRTKTSSS